MQRIERYLFVDKQDLIHTLLEYNATEDKYKVYINPYITYKQSTALESCFVEKGTFNLDDKWSLYYVQQRVIPPNRQGIGGHLKSLGIDHYYEYPFLKAANGRCSNDDQEMKEFDGTYEDFKRLCRQQFEKNN